MAEERNLVDKREDRELPSAHVLVVDDEHSIRHFVKCALADAGYHVTMAASGEEALAKFKEGPDLVVLDMKLPDADGLDLLAQMKQESPDTPVILITAVADVKKAVEAMRRGAFYFLRKPLALDELEGLVREGLEKRRLKLEVEVLRSKMWQEEGIVRCTSPRMAHVYQIVEQVARGENTSVLIEGESGTGKEHIARNIHKLSSRGTKPFLEVNCAAIPRDLLESELFGHEKGAFTDARAQKQGLLELAHGGTLFLDEVGEMSLTLQVKLLRVLERMTFKRVGGVKDISVSVRIISATNQNLEKRVREGAFREDLFYRLKVVPIYVPPLRERRDDILPLAEHFMQQFNVAFKKDFERIQPEAERILVEYPWPGNIRELRNLMERMILLETGTELSPSHLQLGQSPRSPRATGGNDLADRIAAMLDAPGLPAAGVPCEGILEELERALIHKASEASNGNQSRTAELLQMKRDKLRYRMKLYRMNGGHGEDEGTEQTGT
jgi:two-component system, NtrC family, response regulator AtoC